MTSHPNQSEPGAAWSDSLAAEADATSAYIRDLHRVHHIDEEADIPPPPLWRLMLGWLCFQAVMLLPVTLKSPVYCWLLGWAGWFAHRPDAPRQSDEADDREPECWDWIDQLQGQVMQVLAAIGVLMALLLGIAMGIAYL